MGTRQTQQQDDGFTLVELLVVVIIIGVLAVIAIPTYLGQRERAFDAQLTSDLRNAAIRMEQGLRLNDGVYTASALDDFVATQGVITVSSVTSATAFCLTASLAGLPDRVWDSAAGGVQPVGATC